MDPMKVPLRESPENLSRQIVKPLIRSEECVVGDPWWTMGASQNR